MMFSHNLKKIREKLSRWGRSTTCLGSLEVWKRASYPIEIKSNPLIHSEYKGKVDNNVMSTAEE